MDLNPSSKAVRERPAGRLEASIGTLEGQANLLSNNIGRLDAIIRRLRGNPPPSPTVTPDRGERPELVRPLSDRASVLCDTFGDRNAALDNLLSELDGLI